MSKTSHVQMTCPNSKHDMSKTSHVHISHVQFKFAYKFSLPKFSQPKFALTRDVDLDNCLNAAFSFNYNCLTLNLCPILKPMVHTNLAKFITK